MEKREILLLLRLRLHRVRKLLPLLRLRPQQDLQKRTDTNLLAWPMKEASSSTAHAPLHHAPRPRG
jgi:hypothetical protein